MRRFNDLAVPGMGNASYGRQFVLALLGVQLAEQARRVGQVVSTIAAANAVEAVAVWAAFHRTGWNADDRLPGIRKLGRHGLTGPPSFKRAASRTFYVTQPMRIRTVEGLAALGFVNAPTQRFSTYSCSELGAALLAAACPLACDKLLGWVMGEDLPRTWRSILKTIDPTLPLPISAREILREAIAGASVRRRDALAWVEALKKDGRDHVEWDRPPTQLTEPEHWADLRAGARFAAVVEAAAGEIEDGSVLARVENRMLATGARKMSWVEAADASLRPMLDELRVRAEEFLTAAHDPSPDGEASRFCRECVAPDGVEVLRRLVARDGRVLMSGGDGILAGPAFLSAPSRPSIAASGDEIAAEAADEELSNTPLTQDLPALPERISHRIHNLMLLTDDLRSACSSGMERR
ncbi:hypothetical protein [Sphingomonas sp. Leaf38]|uniref:hypothetical protein n=1 Tax=Sphingomonas sp. Leaf38 TaxID=1736217 RepID=UPI0012E315C5|nr:hypothetical protein [Sphingomonas sp. Leaf38]